MVLTMARSRDCQLTWFGCAVLSVVVGRWRTLEYHGSIVTLELILNGEPWLYEQTYQIYRVTTREFVNQLLYNKALLDGVTLLPVFRQSEYPT